MPTIHHISTSIEKPSTCCHQKIYVFYIEFPSLLITDLISITYRSRRYFMYITIKPEYHVFVRSAYDSWT